MITGRPDALVYNREGKPVLVVEVKSRFDVTQSWAARTFRNLYVHGSIPDVPYFLLVLPEAFYLWREPARKVLEAAYAGGDGVEEVGPDYVEPAWETIRPYLGGGDVSPEEVSGYSMEMIVNAFIADLLNSDLSPESVPDRLRWLFSSGLYEAIRGGALADQAPL